DPVPLHAALPVLREARIVARLPHRMGAAVPEADVAVARRAEEIVARHDLPDARLELLDGARDVDVEHRLERLMLALPERHPHRVGPQGLQVRLAGERAVDGAVDADL